MVKMVVGLKISIVEFDNAKQLTFRQGIADVAAVAVGKVRIANIEAQTPSRRRLLIDSIKIDVEVAAKDTNAAASVANKLTVENINLQLGKAGLPEAEVLSIPVVSAVPSPLAEPEDKSNNLTILIVVVCAGAGAVVLGIAVFVYRRHRTLVHLEMEGSLHSRVTTDLDTQTSDDSPTNNMRARQEALTSSNGTLGPVYNDQAHIGQYQPINTQDVHLDSVVMHLHGDDPAIVRFSPPEPVPVLAYELFDFTAPADGVKNSIARQIRTLRLDKKGGNVAVNVTVDHGFMTQPMEASSVLQSLSVQTPANAAANTTRAASPTAIWPSLTARVIARAASRVLGAPDEVASRQADEVYIQPSQFSTRNMGAEFSGRSLVIASMNALMPPGESSDETEPDE